MNAGRCKGMTLVEMLIALVLLGLVFALGFEALYVGSRSLQATTRAADSNSEWRQSARMLGRFLRQSQAIKVLHENDVHKMLFTGGRDHLMWAAPLTGQGAGIYELSLEQEGDELLLSYAPLRAADHDDKLQPDAATKLRLMSPIRGLQLSYYGAERPDERPRWHRQWIDKAALPQLVRLSVKRERQSSDLVFALTISSLSNNAYQVLRHDYLQ